MAHFELVDPLPLDLDVHEIPARGPEPLHYHHDLRFLLVAGPDQTLKLSNESNALKWFPIQDLESVIQEENLLRLGQKALNWLSS